MIIAVVACTSVTRGDLYTRVCEAQKSVYKGNVTTIILIIIITIIIAMI